MSQYHCPILSCQWPTGHAGGAWEGMNRDVLITGGPTWSFLLVLWITLLCHPKQRASWGLIFGFHWRQTYEMTNLERCRNCCSRAAVLQYRVVGKPQTTLSSLQSRNWIRRKKCSFRAPLFSGKVFSAQRCRSMKHSSSYSYWSP